MNIIDVVHAATALLECGGLAGKDDLPSPSAHVDKFWQCYHALSWGSDGGELRRGLDLAKRVQKALIRYELRGRVERAGFMMSSNVYVVGRKGCALMHAAMRHLSILQPPTHQTRTNHPCPVTGGAWCSRSSFTIFGDSEYTT